MVHAVHRAIIDGSGVYEDSKWQITPSGNRWESSNAVQDWWHTGNLWVFPITEDEAMKLLPPEAMNPNLKPRKNN